MTQIRTIYEEIIADLRLKGFGGYVDKLHDYKNDTDSITKPTVVAPNQKTKNVEEAAVHPPCGLLTIIKVT